MDELTGQSPSVSTTESTLSAEGSKRLDVVNRLTGTASRTRSIWFDGRMLRGDTLTRDQVAASSLADDDLLTGGLRASKSNRFTRIEEVLESAAMSLQENANLGNSASPSLGISTGRANFPFVFSGDGGGLADAIDGMSGFLFTYDEGVLELDVIGRRR